MYALRTSSTETGRTETPLIKINALKCSPIHSVNLMHLDMYRFYWDVTLDCLVCIINLFFIYSS